MTVYTDISLWALATLQANSSVVAGIYGGVDAIVGSGNMTPERLGEEERERLDAKINDQALAIVVIDRGEREQGTVRRVFFDVYIYDRRKDYTNIRTVRESVIAALKNRPVSLVRDAFVVQVHYAGRSGHENFDEFDLDYESVSFDGDLVFSGPSDLYA